MRGGMKRERHQAQKTGLVKKANLSWDCVRMGLWQLVKTVGLRVTRFFFRDAHLEL